jgi:predicted dienelactone hydrolase
MTMRDTRATLFTLALAATMALPLHAAPVDAPELASPGPHAVGVRRVQVEVGPVVDVDAAAKGDSAAAAQTRTLDALLWYPAAGSAPARATTLERELKNHPWRGWATPTLRTGMPSVALADAAPAEGTGRFPMAIVSHGLLNWAETMSDLAEHLASRGYAVLAIQHEDERHADPLRAALALRPLDQGAALRAVEQIDSRTGDPLRGRLQAQRVALIGYSMGGYGALITAGARVASDGAAFQYGTPTAMTRHTQALPAADAALRERVAAVVAFAPFGAQMAIGAFKPAGLRELKAPSLVVVGDQDDISGYADGVRSAWESLTAAPRWLLTYENARHNIVMNGPPSGAPPGFRTWEAFEEPVWRRDRLLEINRHFVTAFLDRHFRGDASRDKWLTLASVRSNDGAWPVPFGTPATGAFAGPAQGAVTHWTGFQRRWAVGMRLEKRDGEGR